MAEKSGVGTLVCSGFRSSRRFRSRKIYTTGTRTVSRFHEPAHGRPNIALHEVQRTAPKGQRRGDVGLRRADTSVARFSRYNDVILARPAGSTDHRGDRSRRDQVESDYDPRAMGLARSGPGLIADHAETAQRAGEGTSRSARERSGGVDPARLAKC